MKENELLLQKNFIDTSVLKLPTTQLKDPCFILLSDSIVSKYNIFIHCYNHDCNRIDERTLSFMPQSQFFNLFQSFLRSSSKLIAFLILFLIPILNILFFITFILLVVKYFKAYTIYKTNRKKIPDPMKNMKYDPQKCFQLQKNFHFFILNFKNDLISSFNIKQNTQLTYKQGKTGSKYEIMVYNAQFAKYYNEFPSWRLKFILILITSLIVTFFSNFLLGILI